LWGFFYYLLDVPLVYFFVKPFRKLFNRFQSVKLRAFIKSENPDVIAATHFYAAEVVAELRKRGEFSGRLITVITDVVPHAFWVNEQTDSYWVMSDESAKNLTQRGVDPRKVTAGGIPVKTIFLQQENRAELTQKLGLTPHRLNILFTSGSFGIGPIIEQIRELTNLGGQIQVMVVCGRNKKLYHRLANARFTFPVMLMGFVNNMHELMSVSDLMVAKPGGSTTCESLVKNLPMMISAAIPGQETRNARWLLKNRAAVEFKKKGDLNQVIQKILRDVTMLKTLKENAARIARPKAAQAVSDFIVQLGKVSGGVKS